jgi:hypothetical protein
MGAILSIPESFPPEYCVLSTYWLRLRGDRLVPSREEIDPGSIVSLLPFIVLTEIFSPMDARVRLAGTALRDLFGFDPSGWNYVELTGPEGRRSRGYRMWTMTHWPCGAYFSRQVTFATGAHETTYGIALPVAPGRTGGAPFILSMERSHSGRRWLNPGSGPMIEPVSEFVFLDIGAGCPASTQPPDDWQFG